MPHAPPGSEEPFFAGRYEGVFLLQSTCLPGMVSGWSAHLWDFAQPFAWIFGNIDAQEAFEDCDKSTISRTAHQGQLST